MIPALVHAGVPVVAGTDLVVPGHSIARELELYVRAGLTPMEALHAATIVPARAMGIDKDYIVRDVLFRRFLDLQGSDK